MIKPFFCTSTLIVALFLPLLFLFLAPPTSKDISAASAQYAALAAAYALYVAAFGGFLAAKRREELSRYLLPGVLLLSTALLVALSFKLPSLPFYASLLCACAVVAGAYAAFEKHLRLQGLISLLIFLTFFVTLEMCLRSAPVEIFAKSVVEIPPLAPADRGNEILRTNGFRGRWPCTDCSPKPVRIVVMGGSSTYGIPLPSAELTFSAHLQRLLDKERPNEKYEVLNAGVAGYGIVQVADSLENYVLQFEPDIVIVNSWFNDSAKGAGWYGYAGLSDREAQDRVELFRAIDGRPIYQFISRLRLYGVFRHYVLGVTRRPAVAQDKKSLRKERRRSNPAEFSLEVERIAKLGQEKRFLPVFLYEVTNRQDDLKRALQKNPYFRAISDLAPGYGFPVIDTVTPFAARRGDWLFSDFIHPNRDGHELIAELIHEHLFTQSPTSLTGLFLAQRGIPFTAR